MRGRLRLSNPLSEDESVLRPSLIPGLILAAKRNVARSSLPATLFEIGNVFDPGADGTVNEREKIGFVLAGPTPPTPYEAQRELDFSDGKGAVERLASGLGVAELTFTESDGEGVGHPGRSATVLAGDRLLGILMEVQPSIAKAFDLPRRVVVCELDLQGLFAGIKDSVATSPPRYPAVIRDVAIVVPIDARIADVEEQIRGAAGLLLARTELFDVYMGEQIPEDTKSLAFSLTLLDPEKTLTDADADAVMERISSAAGAAGWTIRI
jgi:phenylalanyl-tRNA synthetase beta chain